MVRTIVGPIFVFGALLIYWAFGDRISGAVGLPEWAARLACSQFGSRGVDFVVSLRSHSGLDDR